MTSSNCAGTSDSLDAAVLVDVNDEDAVIQHFTSTSAAALARQYFGRLQEERSRLVHTPEISSREQQRMIGTMMVAVDNAAVSMDIQLMCAGVVTQLLSRGSCLQTGARQLWRMVVPSWRRGRVAAATTRDNTPALLLLALFSQQRNALLCLPWSTSMTERGEVGEDEVTSQCDVTNHDITGHGGDAAKLRCDCITSHRDELIGDQCEVITDSWQVSFAVALCARVVEFTDRLCDRPLAYRLLSAYCRCLCVVIGSSGARHQTSPPPPSRLLADFLLRQFIMPAARIVCYGWCAQTSRVSELLRHSMVGLLCVADAVDQRQSAVDFILATSVDGRTWSCRVKLNVLTALTRHLSSSWLLQRWPDILRQLSGDALSVNHLAHASTELFSHALSELSQLDLIEQLTDAVLHPGRGSSCDREATESQLPDEDGQEWQRKVRHYEEASVLCLQPVSIMPLQTLVTHWLPVLVRKRRVCASALLRRIDVIVSTESSAIDSWSTSGEWSYRERCLYIGVCLVSALRSNHVGKHSVTPNTATAAVSDHNDHQLGARLVRLVADSLRPQLRCVAVMAACSGPAVRVFDSADQVSEAVRCLATCVATDCPATRHTVVCQLRRVGRTLLTDTSPLTALVASGLRPGASYHRRIMSLLMARQMSPRQLTALRVCSRTAGGVTVDATRLLFTCVYDPANDVRRAACELFVKLSLEHQQNDAQWWWRLLVSQSCLLADSLDPRRTAIARSLTYLLISHPAWHQTATTTDTDASPSHWHGCFDHDAVLDAHLTALSSQLAVFADGMQQAAQNSPVHGRLGCVRKMVCISRDACAPQRLWTALTLTFSVIERALVVLGQHRASDDVLDDNDDDDDESCSLFVSASFADIDLKAQHPSVIASKQCAAGHLSDDRVRRDATQRRILVCCWLNLKQGCRMLADYSDVYLSHEAASTSEAVRFCDVQRAVACLQRVLLTCRHKGAIEAAKNAWTCTCRAAFRSDDGRHSVRWMTSSTPAHEPGTLLELIVNVVRRIVRAMRDGVDGASNSQCSVTRRAAGRPMLLLGVLSSCSQELLDCIIKQLLDIAAAQPPASVDQHVDLSQTDAIHVLHTVTANCVVSQRLTSHWPTLTVLALRSLNSRLWCVRNASMLLFAALLPRLVGQKASRSQPQLNRVSVREFSGRMGEAVWQPLLHCMITPSAATVAALSLLSRLGRPGIVDERIMSAVRRLLSAPQWTLRKLAAHTLYALSDPAQLTHELCETIASKNVMSFNQLHGWLLLATLLVKHETMHAQLRQMLAHVMAREPLVCPPVLALCVQLACVLSVDLARQYVDGLLAVDRVNVVYCDSLLALCTEYAMHYGHYQSVYSVCCRLPRLTNEYGIDSELYGRIIVVMFSAVQWILSGAGEKFTLTSDWLELCACVGCTLKTSDSLTAACFSVCERCETGRHMMGALLPVYIKDQGALMTPAVFMSVCRVATCSVDEIHPDVISFVCTELESIVGESHRDAEWRTAAGQCIGPLWTKLMAKQPTSVLDSDDMWHQTFQMARVTMCLLIDEESSVRTATYRSLSHWGRVWQPGAETQMICLIRDAFLRAQGRLCPSDVLQTEWFEQRLDLSSCLVKADFEFTSSSVLDQFIMHHVSSFFKSQSPCVVLLNAASSGGWQHELPCDWVRPDRADVASPHDYCDAMSVMRAIVSFLHHIEDETTLIDLAWSAFTPNEPVSYLQSLSDERLSEVLLWPGMYTSLGCARLLLSLVDKLFDESGACTVPESCEKTGQPCHLDWSSSAPCSSRREGAIRLKKMAAEMDHLITRCNLVPAWI